MRTYREVLKYLKDYVVDRIILTEFDPETLSNEWEGYTPTSDQTMRTVYDYAVKFEEIIADTPIILHAIDVERLDDRSTLEVDLFLGLDTYEQDEQGDDITTLPRNGLEISLCQGYNINSPKMILKNTDEIPFNELVTVSFSINTSIVNRVDDLARIKTIGFNFKENLDELYISKVDAINPEFTFTIEDIEEQYVNGLDYVLTGLGLPELPDSRDLLEATYKATSAYLWMKQEGNQAKYGNSRNYAVHLFKLADHSILKYKNEGDVALGNQSIRQLGGYEWSKIQ